MKGILRAAVAASALAFSTTAFAEPKQLWEVAGLKTPESALFDARTNSIYVSNIDGSPLDKDGKGQISRISLDGKTVKQDWISGLNAPTGMAVHDGRLFVADVDELIEIDIDSGQISKRHAATGAKFLNDVASSKEGHIYATDMLSNAVWRLAGEKFEVWFQDDDLKNPNGVTVADDAVYIASWGKIDGEQFATSVAGHVLSISLSDKTLKDVGSDKPIGNLDGIESVGASLFLLTDWVKGGLFSFDANTGASTSIMSLGSGSADFGLTPDRKVVFVPMMKDGKLLAIQLE